MQEWSEQGQCRRVDWNESEQIEEIGWVLRRKVVDPSEKRRVPHLDGDEQDLVQREKDRDLDHDRQAAAQRIDLFPLVQLHQFLLLLGLVVGITFAQSHHLRLHGLHLRH